MTTALITRSHTGEMQMTFPHSTGTLFFSDINAAGEWVREHSGQMGGFVHNSAGVRVARKAIFRTDSKLPKWARIVKTEVPQ
jgi:hypothetical protein